MEFEEIYRKYFQAVYLYIRRLSGDGQIAEEITSETFFKALKAIDDFRGECDLRVWLCQIAKNSYASYLKKNQRLVPWEEQKGSKQGDNGDMEQRLLQQEASLQIQQHLHNLADPYKEVFMWRVFGELSFKQIGQLFHKTENWACVTYHRAKTMLKNKVEEDKHDKGM